MFKLFMENFVFIIIYDNDMIWNGRLVSRALEYYGKLYRNSFIKKFEVEIKL